MDYYSKYLKYKQKYLDLKQKINGGELKNCRTTTDILKGNPRNCKEECGTCGFTPGCKEDEMSMNPNILNRAKCLKTVYPYTTIEEQKNVTKKTNITFPKHLCKKVCA